MLGAFGPRLLAVALLFLTACRQRTEEMSMDPMEALGPLAANPAMLITPLFVALGYFFILLDRREDRPSKDDKQIGSKLVLWSFILAGISGVLGGADSIIVFVLGGFKGGFGMIKMPLASLISGVVVAGAFAMLFLPRTNNATASQVERFAMGVLALSTGLMAITSLNTLIMGLFAGAKWGQMSSSLAHIVVHGAAAAFALTRHGTMSGWTAPPPRPAAPAGYPGGPAGGGYPQQGGGYPPQGGGYPPQGGGYPPQGGGYPPQGGGYPPQGGYGR
jgi:hypothetical protein